MSGPGKKKTPSLPTLLSEEDRELWGFVARSVGAARGKSRVRDVEPDIDAIAAELERARNRPQPQKPARQPAPPRASLPPPRCIQPAKAEPKHVPLERRKARRIARGAEEIDARLDLHGMTQDDAHGALIGFIRRCHAGGLRTVLVITGKGGVGRGHRDADDDVVPRPRGILRRNVPRWLAGPEIGSLVISYTTAHVRHGGEGALYVRLRKRG